MRALVIGGAGFIGSHLVDALVTRGDQVVAFDNLSNGKITNLNNMADLVVGDIFTEPDRLIETMQGCDIVYHLAANPEARAGLSNTRLDLEQGTIATYNVLEAMRQTGVLKLFFASSGTVYSKSTFKCKEGDLQYLPVSLYGASKLACEALCSSFSECFGIEVTIARFGNVIGPRASHGVIFDLLKKLKENPSRLEVLGDGTMTKPYVHVSDIVRGILHILDLHYDNRTWNIAPNDTTTVKYIVESIVNSISPTAHIEYGAEPAGWKGDVCSWLDSNKLLATNFKLTYDSDQAVKQAIKEITPEVFPAYLLKLIETDYYGKI